MRDFRDIVQFSGGDGKLAFHFSPYRKQIEKRQMAGVGNQEAGHALQLADMQRPLGSIGQGMGQTLTLTGEKQAYTLTDRATYATYKAKTGLEIMVEGAKQLLNPYGVIAVNPKRYPSANYAGAMDFIEWLTSTEGQKAIAEFRPQGAQLFFPDYKK